MRRLLSRRLVGDDNISGPHEGEELPITTRIYAAVDTIRTVHDDVDAADPSSADLLHRHR